MELVKYFAKEREVGYDDFGRMMFIINCKVNLEGNKTKRYLMVLIKLESTNFAKCKYTRRAIIC